MVSAKYVIKLFYCFIFIFLSSFEVKADELVENNQLKGYFEFDKIVKNRMLRSGSDFNLAQLLNERVDGRRPGIYSLLGIYVLSEGQMELRNGSPNSINILIWKNLALDISRKISDICIGKPVLPFSVELSKLILESCAFPFFNIPSEKWLEDLWLVLMSYDAPYNEYEEWKVFVKKISSTHNNKDFLVGSIFTIFMNPFFILQR